MIGIICLLEVVKIVCVVIGFVLEFEIIKCMVDRDDDILIIVLINCKVCYIFYFIWFGCLGYVGCFGFVVSWGRLCSVLW